MFNGNLKSNSAQNFRNKSRNAVTAEDADREGSGKSRQSRDSGIGSASAGRLLESSLDKKKSAELLLQKQPSPPMRIDSTKIMESLRKEGLLGDPKTSVKTSGVSFEIALDELKVRSKRPPAHLQKLDRVVAMRITTEKIVNKLKNAEQRRKVNLQCIVYYS